MWLICSRAATIEFKWGFGFKIEILTLDSISSSNYLNCLEFELDERTPGQRFWKLPSVARLFGAGWTRGVISWRSETDHYRYPLYFPLFARGRKPSLGRYEFLETLRDGRGEDREGYFGPGFESVDAASVLVLYWHAFTGRQSLKYASYPLQCWSNYWHFVAARRSRWVPCI